MLPLPTYCFIRSNILVNLKWAKTPQEWNGPMFDILYKCVKRKPNQFISQKARHFPNIIIYDQKPLLCGFSMISTQVIV